MFRTPADLLESDKAWVKCGRCKKVFDANKNTIDPSTFLKTIESSDVTSTESESGNQTEKIETSSSTEEDTDSADLKAQPEKQLPEKNPESQSETRKLSSPLIDNTSDNKKSAAIDAKLESENRILKPESEPRSSTSNSTKDIEQLAEPRLSFIKNKEDKKVETQAAQTPLFNTKSDNPDTNESARSQANPSVKSAQASIKSVQLKATQNRVTEGATLNPQSRENERFNPKKSTLAAKSFSPSVTPTREKTLAEQQKINAKAEKKRKAEKSQWTKMILAQAQSWKSEKNRFQSRRSYTGILAIIGLVALLIWQVAIVNYSKLVTYDFLKGPLNLTCAVLSCNKERPNSGHEFEILHANLRRHQTNPGVMTISANLINYSNSDKLLPSIRLDLTDVNETVVASRTINLVENPQYIDPAISMLSPGQDIKLKLDIDRPISRAVGFELSVIK